MAVSQRIRHVLAVVAASLVFATSLVSMGGDSTAQANGSGADWVEIQIRRDHRLSVGATVELSLRGSAVPVGVGVADSQLNHGFPRTVTFTVPRTEQYRYLHARTTSLLGQASGDLVVTPLWGDDLVPSASTVTLGDGRGGLTQLWLQFAPAVPEPDTSPGLVEIRMSFDAAQTLPRVSASLNLHRSAEPWDTLGRNSSPSSGNTSVFTVPLTERYRYLHAYLRDARFVDGRVVQTDLVISQLWADDLTPLVDAITLTDAEGRPRVINLDFTFLDPQDPGSTVPPADLPQTLGLSGDLTPSPDPDIARDGDWYYVYLTGPGVTVKRSADLVHWEEIESVFAEPIPAWMNEYPWIVPGEEGGLGAPDVEYFGGRWHLYYHSHEFATNNAITGHASNVTLDPDDPDYEWIDDGLVMSSSADTDSYSVLDANAVVDEHGVPWLSFGSFWDGIQLVELDPSTGAPVPDAPFTLLAARDPWFLGVEASSMVFHDGFWYLFVSWGFCCRGVDTQYEIRVGRSVDISGPYLDITGTPMLNNGGSLLIGAYGDRVRGPGSGDVLVAGEDSLLVHHWYDAENDGEVTLGVRPLLWSPDGWPIAADTGFQALADGAADEAAVAGTWSVSQYVEEQSATFELLEGGSLAGGAGSWKFDAANGVVTVHAECSALMGTMHTFVVGADLATGFGHSDSPFPVRAVRTDDAATC